MVRKVYVVGMGMGNAGTLTLAARDALSKSELIVGSSRLLQALESYDGQKAIHVGATDIARTLRESTAAVASVVMSGDVGFYSGATRLYEHLEGIEVEVLPGVSSLSYLCAKLRVPWQEVRVVSSHGRDADVCGVVQANARTFVLLGGAQSASVVCAQLVARGMGSVRVAVGENLSYKSERIVQGTAAELMDRTFDQLCVMLVVNEHPIERACAAPHLPDDAFERGKVPMTKEEVRELCVCKLRIRPNDVVWDVGAGTGSISVEAARAAYAGQVMSVEKNPDACMLIQRNAKSFGLYNLRVVEGEAPRALKTLPAPDCVFVGGSSGSLGPILRTALEVNPRVRICVVAVSLEGVCSMFSCACELALHDVDIVQVGIARSREVGSYHLMQAHNPVYILSAWGGDAHRGG